MEILGLQIKCVGIGKEHRQRARKVFPRVLAEIVGRPQPRLAADICFFSRHADSSWQQTNEGLCRCVAVRCKSRGSGKHMLTPNMARAWQIAMERPPSPALSHLQGQGRMFARLALLVGMLGAILGATLATLALAASHPHAAWQYGSMANASLGIDASLNGAVPFPADN